MYIYKYREYYLNKIFPKEITNIIMTKFINKSYNLYNVIKIKSIYYPKINNKNTRIICHNNYLMQQCNICSHLRIILFDTKNKYIEYPECICHKINL